MTPHRFFPGAQGTEANIVVPITDLSLREPDGHAITHDCIRKLEAETAEVRAELQRHDFAKGNKISCEMKISEVTDKVIRLLLHRGSMGRFQISLEFPQTPALLERKPKTLEEFLAIIAEEMMGGNISNMVRSKAHIAQADLGARSHHIFSPYDRYFTPWLQQQQEKTGNRFTLTELSNISSRTGVAFPYRTNGEQSQLFAINTPQGSTIDPMRPFVRKLRDCTFVSVSEGIGAVLEESGIHVSQLFNPTNALHVESAIELLKRKKNGTSRDLIFVNDSEWDLWIRVMENRVSGTALQELPTALFPSPFKLENKNAIDPAAVTIASQNHLRIIHVAEPPSTDHITCRIGIGCGPKGGQYLFQCDGKHYVGAIDTPSDHGAASLITLLGQQELVSTAIRDVMGAGDAAAVAATMSVHYEPLERIIAARDPNLSNDRQKIAAMAFTAILGRVFGELAFRSRGRDLTNVPVEAFPRIFDATLDKAIAAAYKITLLPKIPSSVYEDPEWDLHFTVWELEE